MPVAHTGAKDGINVPIALSAFRDKTHTGDKFKHTDMPACLLAVANTGDKFKHTHMPACL